MVDKLAGIGERFGIRLLACCEDRLLKRRIGKARCVDPELLERIAPSSQVVLFRPILEESGCVASRDIGAYDTCPHGYVYCYANASPDAAIMRYHSREPEKPML